jgi:hypothetical protein
MAQIDPSIAMSFRPIQIESPVNQMAAIAQLRGAQEASQMNALKMQEYQQQQREKNELARIMGDSNLAYGSDDFMRQVLARAPSQYETIATRIAQREDIKERTAKREFETQKLKADLKQRQLEEFKTAQKDISAFNSIQEVKDDIDRKVGSGLLPEDMAANILAGLPTWGFVGAPKPPALWRRFDLGKDQYREYSNSCLWPYHGQCLSGAAPLPRGSRSRGAHAAALGRR